MLLPARTMTKFSWIRETSLTASGSRKMDSGLVLTECLSCWILCFSTPLIDLLVIHSEFSVMLFLGPSPCIRFTCVNDNTEVLVPWKWNRSPVFPVFGWKILQGFFLYFYTVRDWDHRDYMATWSIQKLRTRAHTRYGFWEIIRKSICCRLVV